MELIIATAIATVALVFVTVCAIKLFDMGSSFASLMKMANIPLAILFTVVAVFAFAMPIVSEEADTSLASLIALAGFLAFFAFGKISSHLLEAPKQLKSSKKKSEYLIPFGKATFFDVIGGIFAGFAVGSCFLLGTGLGYLTTTVLGLFVIIEKVALLTRYTEDWSNKKIYANMSMALLAIPIMAVATVWTTSNFASIAIYVSSVGLSYFLYRAAFQGYFLVKKLKK